MSGGRRRLAAGLLAGFCLATPMVANPSLGVDEGLIELSLLRAPAAHEAVWLKLSVGVLPPGGRLEIAAPDGGVIGTVSPFAVRRGQPAGTYLLPLPESTTATGNVRLNLAVRQSGDAPRAPMPGEVEGVELVYVPVTN